MLQMAPQDGGKKYELNSTVDLKSLLPAQVAIGFSAASGWSEELHHVLTWSFDSTLVVTAGNRRRWRAGVVAGVVVASVVVVGASICLLVMIRRRMISRRRTREEYEMGGSDDFDMNDEFEQGTGPRRFLYSQLATATNASPRTGSSGRVASGRCTGAS